MKEELYTIPVNEAIEKDGECLFCTLNKKLENDILNYILGPSYMEEDIRGETDKIGFCREHYRQMHEAQNRLGVALMIDTHLKNLRAELETLLKADEAESSGKKGLFKKPSDTPKSVDYLDNIENSCYACKRMKSRMDSYVDTFFYLWKRENEFKNKILSSKGFCISHFKMLIDEAKKRLSGDKYTDFLKSVSEVQMKNLDKLQEDVDWFIQKFDYRFKDEPWKNSKDALPRAILKLSSIEVEE
ncbi:MAG: DUF6062 family protein [Clostridiales bacterium]|nr:DUF6062 family protein [Clostridiales bacterium]